MGTPGDVSVGPGTLYWAPLGSTEPASLTASWAVAWKEIGFTGDGSTFSENLTTSRLKVAEEIDPVKVVPTDRTSDISFAMAEISAQNLVLAANGGTTTGPTGATGSEYVTFEPPDTGDPTRIMLGWDSDDGEERWIFRQCINTGNTQIARKNSALATISCQFSLEVPATGSKLYKVFLAAARA